VKVVVVGGGGGVGSSTAFNLLRLPGEHEVVLVDCRAEMVTSHVMDLEQVLELGGNGRVRGGPPEEALDADVVVVTAATPLTVNTSRLAYLTSNAEILRGFVDLLRGADRGAGVLLVVTNPVDPLCSWIQRRTGIERGRVLGYTLNDTLRLRTGIAKALGVEPGTVDAWAIGEHGDACVPLFDRVRVGGEPVTLTAAARAEAEEFLRTWYVRHVGLDSGRSSTWTSGLGVARMVAAIADDSGELLPASIVLDGEFGVSGVSLSVPVTLGRRGAARIEEWPLTREQAMAFEHGAEIVRVAAARVEAGLAPTGSAASPG
jgi:malate dehydrogenase